MSMAPNPVLNQPQHPVLEEALASEPSQGFGRCEPGALKPLPGLLGAFVIVRLVSFRITRVSFCGFSGFRKAPELVKSCHGRNVRQILRLPACCDFTT